MSWTLVSLLWYFKLFLLGLICLPLTYRIFGKVFSDSGYAFTKTISLIILTYCMYVLGTLHILPFTFESLLLLALIIALIQWTTVKKQSEIFQIIKRSWKTILFYELVTLTALVAWAFVRGQEPSLHGLEKFMDYGFMNAAVRSVYFPTHDIWLAGKSINYYYFGHLSGATLSQLFQVPLSSGYNLILSTLFALSITQTFSFTYTLIHRAFASKKVAGFGALLGTFIVNLGGNLHTIYLFTKGYEAEKPVPFWEVWSKYNPTAYWYPNATRFIPFTIHEFPLYSYVVADLHGHVFDIPYILTTLACLYLLFLQKDLLKKQFVRLFNQATSRKVLREILQASIPFVSLGGLIGINYMTNAFDGIIYIFAAVVLLFTMFTFSRGFIISLLQTGIGFIAITLPFSLFFEPFGSGVGINCAPAFLTAMGKVGPFLFEKGNCQISQWWMLMLLWGFFVFHALFLGVFLSRSKKLASIVEVQFVSLLFFIGIVLITAPEFVYLKDIYPAHFRANTMFKLGYQAFIMMGIASAFVSMIAKYLWKKHPKVSFLYLITFLPLFFLVGIYPTFAIKSYYGTLQKTPQLDGTTWVDTQYPEYKEVITYLSSVATKDTIILEAQGDSYTDFNLVSSYTGIPTVAGWWVHEWLWRGSSDVIGSLAPDIQEVYQGSDILKKQEIIGRFKIRYIVVGPNERSKYTQLNEEYIKKVATPVFTSNNSVATVYKIAE